MGKIGNVMQSFTTPNGYLEESAQSEQRMKVETKFPSQEDTLQNPVLRHCDGYMYKEGRDKIS